MTPEEYIEKLKEMRRSLSSISHNIDEAVYNMNRRLETGYEVCENSSKIATKFAFEGAKNLEKELAILTVSDIEY